MPINLVTHYKFNPNLTSSWHGSIMDIISNVTMLSIILTGAAVIREREHGTLEHLLVMPVMVQHIMLMAPNTHYVNIAQAILYRGAGIEAVWPQFLMLGLIGCVFFISATTLFRKSVANS